MRAWREVRNFRHAKFLISRHVQVHR